MPCMRIGFYVHAWQGLLMFLAGLVSVLAAFAGYVQSGGGEELLRRVLAGFTKHSARFDALAFKWKTGEMVVTNLKHEKFAWPEKNPIASFDGLLVEEVTVKFDLFPFPPSKESITSITVRGMRQTDIWVSEGFLQGGKLQELHLKNVPPVRFVDCDLKLTIGPVGPLKLSGCSGELRPGSAKEPPRGSFSLRELDGRPFNIRLETLEDGRWVFTGDGIQIDTRAIKRTHNPFAGQMDPVSFLVSALFTGDLGAEGMISSLRLTVQPATGARQFVCDGEVGYQNLKFQLPKPAADAGVVLPWLISVLFGAGEGFWPRWMQVDTIRTGADGRVAFHMANGRLNFACDEGLGSALMGIREGQSFPPLEALKGAVETYEDNRTKRIVLRGFLGEELAFETHVENHPDRSRTSEMLLEPRGTLPQAGAANADKPVRPLWRFASRLADYFEVKKEQRPDVAGERTLVSFALEGEARHFPRPDWLPPGLRDVSGHLSAQGRFTDQQRLCVDGVSLDDGARLVYGGAVAEGKNANAAPDFGPLWEALQEFFCLAKPWEVQNLALRGRAKVEFSPDLRWQSTDLSDFVLISGSLVYQDRITDLAAVGPVLEATHTREAEVSDIGVQAAVPDKWKVRFTGAWKPDGTTGTFKLLEQNVPAALYPQPPIVPTVSRETTLQITKGKPPERQLRPLDGVR
ncbi:MAG: hypothetical protein ABSE73_26240 [Planctomycetota bacterium]